LSVVNESEILAKISDFFIEYAIRVRLSAGVGVLSIIKGAIQAAPQVSAAPRTGVPPPDAVFELLLLLASITSLHRE